MTSWGQHLSIDAKGSNDNVKDKDAIVDFFDTLVRAIDMEFWDDEDTGRNKLCVHFGKDDKSGFTYSALITTSNISCHFCDNGEFYADIFSCKPVDEELVKTLFQVKFQPSQIRSRFFVRGEW